MDDLIASLSGGVHVSQEAYDLEAVKAHFARTLVLPVIPIPLSPVSPSRPLPGSRSQSRSRPPPVHCFDAPGQPFPSPALLFQPQADAAMLSPAVGRPHATRAGSYGFAGAMPQQPMQTQSEPASPSALEYEPADAFASSWADDGAWAAQPAGALEQKSPWAAFGVGSTSAAGAFVGYAPFASDYDQRRPFSQSPARPAFAAPPFAFGAQPAPAYAPSPIGFDAARCQAPPSPPMDEDESMDEDGVALDSIEDELDEEAAVNSGGDAWRRGRW